MLSIASLSTRYQSHSENCDHVGALFLIPLSLSVSLAGPPFFFPFSPFFLFSEIFAPKHGFKRHVAGIFKDCHFTSIILVFTKKQYVQYSTVDKPGIT